MRLRTLQALLFVLVLSVFAADFSVGCGQGYVYGPVTQKFQSGGDNDGHTIAVNGTPYTVPLEFFNRVSVGDTVKFAGSTWQIVKTASGTTPPTSTP
jgi:hypothetical protein